MCAGEDDSHPRNKELWVWTAHCVCWVPVRCHSSLLLHPSLELMLMERGDRTCSPTWVTQTPCRGLMTPRTEVSYPLFSSGSGYQVTPGNEHPIQKLSGNSLGSPSYSRNAPNVTHHHSFLRDFYLWYLPSELECWRKTVLMLTH